MSKHYLCINQIDDLGITVDVVTTGPPSWLNPSNRSAVSCSLEACIARDAFDALVCIMCKHCSMLDHPVVFSLSPNTWPLCATYHTSPYFLPEHTCWRLQKEFFSVFQLNASHVYKNILCLYFFCETKSFLHFLTVKCVKCSSSVVNMYILEYFKGII